MRGIIRRPLVRCRRRDFIFVGNCAISRNYNPMCRLIASVKMQSPEAMRPSASEPVLETGMFCVPIVSQV